MQPSAKTQAVAGDCHVGLRPPRNDKSGGLAPLNHCRDTCNCHRRSLSAATDAIGAFYFNDSLYQLPVHHRADPSPPRTIFSISHLFRTFCRMLNVFVMVHKLWVHFLAVQCIAERGRICYNLWY